jgi:tRNA (cytidine32/guanosine34-2'-O)-methyltransferase
MEDLTLTQTEAFLVCRNFDPSKVPLPETFSSESLAELAKQTKGTLTLDSLAHLSPETQPVNRMWGVLRAWVGSGDLKCVKETHSGVNH